MAKYVKVCFRCGVQFHTDSACRKYCYGSCSHEADIERRPENQRKYKARKKFDALFAKLFQEKTIAEVNHEAREAGMTYGQYVAWEWCQEDIAKREAERKQGIRYLDRFLDKL